MSEYQEETATSPFGPEPVDRTTLKIGDVTLICDDFPGLEMSCTRA